MATGFCPSNCTDVVLTGNPSGDCPNTGQRKMTIARLGFMVCSINLPSLPYTQANIQPLIDSGQMAASSPLANVELGDPEYTKLNVADCMPSFDYFVKRTLTAEDTIMIQLKDANGNITDAAFDHKFWANKMEHRLILRTFLVMCNGDVYFARDEDGNIAQSSFNAFRSIKDMGEGVGKIEVKKVSAEWNVDPLPFRDPDFNINELGVTL